MQRVRCPVNAARLTACLVKNLVVAFEVVSSMNIPVNLEGRSSKGFILS